MTAPNYIDVGKVWDGELCGQHCEYLDEGLGACGEPDDTCAILGGNRSHCAIPADFCPAVEDYLKAQADDKFEAQCEADTQNAKTMARALFGPLRGE